MIPFGIIMDQSEHDLGLRYGTSYLTPSIPTKLLQGTKRTCCPCQGPAHVTVTSRRSFNGFTSISRIIKWVRWKMGPRWLINNHTVMAIY